MAHYDADVIVVGGGPAGGMAAWHLAPHCRVLLIERARLPRDKLCSGVLTAKSLELLGDALDPVPYRVGTAERVVITHRGRGRPLQLGRPLHFISRARMDAALVAAAARRGADIRDGTAVAGVDPEQGAVRLAGGFTLRARVVIGADGASGVCARAGGRIPPPGGVAIEVRIPDPRGSGRRPALIEAALPGGYLWAFPKADGSVAVGAGTMVAAVGRDLRRRVAEWVARVLGVAVPARIPGHLLAFRPARSPERGRLLLVGDAAGLMDPLLGEGIPYALWSGRLAGEHVLRRLAGEPRVDAFADGLATLLHWRRPYAVLGSRGDLVRRLMALHSVAYVGWPWLVDRTPQRAEAR